MPGTNQNINTLSVEQKMDRQLELLEKIAKQTKKTQVYIFWIKIFNFLRLLILVGSIILTIKYLPPLLQKMADKYKEFMENNNLQLQVDPSEFLKNINLPVK